MTLHVSVNWYLKNSLSTLEQGLAEDEPECTLSDTQIQSLIGTLLILPLTDFCQIQSGISTNSENSSHST